MKKSLFIIAAVLLSVLNAGAAMTADWRIHLPFDEFPAGIIETPQRVYFYSGNFQYNAGQKGRDILSYTLHYYDKEGDELLTVNSRDNASGDEVSVLAYNPEKKYLMVVYSDCNIDFLYDDGRTANLPALKVTSIPGTKEVTDITFDNANNLAYLATTFGYISVNDEKHEVAESRIYNHPLSSIARCGDNMVIVSGGQLLTAPAVDKRFNFEDYAVIAGAPSGINRLLPFDNGSFMAVKTGSNGTAYYFPSGGKDAKAASSFDDPNIFNVQRMKNDKYSIVGNVQIYHVGADGSTASTQRPEEAWRNPAMSTDMLNVWSLAARKGLKLYSRQQTDQQFSVSKDYMRPNAPAVYNATSFAYNPDYGMLVGSNGPDVALTEISQYTPLNISALKGGFWKEYSPLYTVPDRFYSLANFFGLAVDPQNPKYLYRSSVTGGMVRINLEDPDDIMIFGNSRNGNAGDKGFIANLPVLDVWDALMRLTTPGFDSNGTMWTGFHDADALQLVLYYWPAADRAASTNPQTFRPWKSIRVSDAFYPSNYDLIAVLNANANKGIITAGGTAMEGQVLIYDTNNTPDNTSDDKFVVIRNPYDQDGGAVKFGAVNHLLEDPETGLLWIITQRGVFTVNPRTALEDPTHVNRIKISRNDGTTYADYLLNEVNVNHMNIDREGRKWFSTSDGLVCVSQDSRSKLGEFTADNSYLPDNNVYASAYNPQNGSIIIGTKKGIAELFPSGSGSGSSAQTDGVRAYPNPVEPTYYGWVKIDNIADGSLVKITDSRGGLVKELGPVEGGGVEWDISGLNNSRVATGVYYIMVSPPSGGGETSISKILVLN